MHVWQCRTRSHPQTQMFTDPILWIRWHSACIAGVSILLFAVGSPMFSRNGRLCIVQSALHTLWPNHWATVSDKKCKLSVGDFSVSSQCDCSVKTKTMLNLLNLILTILRHRQWEIEIGRLGVCLFYLLPLFVLFVCLFYLLTLLVVFVFFAAFVCFICLFVLFSAFVCLSSS